MKASRNRKLTAEDRMLWGRVARTTTPLHGPESLERLMEDLEPKPDTRDPVIKRAAPSFLAPHPVPPQVPRKPSPAYDAPTRRKLDKGRIAIDGRVDLHGLHQAEAHSVLLAFLHRAHAAGHRHVLVITGKGASLGSDGVLNRSLPAWLGTAPFRALVSGYNPAGRRHGGTGAFYVRIRRRTPGGDAR